MLQLFLTRGWEFAENGVIDHVERMICRGGFSATATPRSYRRHRDEIGEYLAHLWKRERQLVFGGPGNRLFGFDSLTS